MNEFLCYLNYYGTGIIAVCTALYLFVTWLILNENKKLYCARYMPIILVSYDRVAKHFKATNIGSGLAINIEIGSFHLFAGDMQFSLHFQKIFNLEPGKAEVLSYFQEINGERLQDGPLDAHLYTSYGKEDYKFTLIVRDILNNIYYQKVNMGKSGIC